MQYLQLEKKKIHDVTNAAVASLQSSYTMYAAAAKPQNDRKSTCVFTAAVLRCSVCTAERIQCRLQSYVHASCALMRHLRGIDRNGSRPGNRCTELHGNTAGPRNSDRDGDSRSGCHHPRILATETVNDCGN